VSAVAVRVRGRGSRGGRGRGDAVSAGGGAGGAGVAIGRRGVPDVQRARMLGSLVEAVSEYGAARVTVSRIVARSGVSRRTFYEMFADRDACFMAALELAIERGAARVLPAFERGWEGAGADGVRAGAGADDVWAGAGGGARGGRSGEGAARWCGRVRAGLGALLEFLDDEPGLGGLCVVDALSAGPRAMQRRAEVVRALVDAVDAGRGEAEGGLEPTRLTAEGVVGGVLGVLYARFTERDPRPMSKLLNPLMGMIVLPYLGPAAAAREVAMSAPRVRRRSQRTISNPLEGLDMRLTYRTMRVLAAIAELDGQGSKGGQAGGRADGRLGGGAPSNRQVADASGVHDQGQISKLLLRLERLGLVANVGVGPVRGEPNAWRLTPRGREVEYAIREQATPTGT
jgi:AcrR family transcriptional regulator